MTGVCERLAWTFQKKTKKTTIFWLSRSPYFPSYRSLTHASAHHITRCPPPTRLPSCGPESLYLQSIFRLFWQSEIWEAIFPSRWCRPNSLWTLNSRRSLCVSSSVVPLCWTWPEIDSTLIRLPGVRKQRRGLLKFSLLFSSPREVIYGSRGCLITPLSLPVQILQWRTERRVYF